VQAEAEPNIAVAGAAEVVDSPAGVVGTPAGVAGVAEAGALLVKSVCRNLYKTRCHPAIGHYN